MLINQILALRIRANYEIIFFFFNQYDEDLDIKYNGKRDINYLAIISTFYDTTPILLSIE